MRQTHFLRHFPLMCIVRELVVLLCAQFTEMVASTILVMGRGTAKMPERRFASLPIATQSSSIRTICSGGVGIRISARHVCQDGKATGSIPRRPSLLEVSAACLLHTVQPFDQLGNGFQALEGIQPRTAITPRLDG